MPSAGFAEAIVNLVRSVDRALVDLDEREEPELLQLAADLRGLRTRMLRQLGEEGTAGV